MFFFIDIPSFFTKIRLCSIDSIVLHCIGFSSISHVLRGFILSDGWGVSPHYLIPQRSLQDLLFLDSDLGVFLKPFLEKLSVIEWNSVPIFRLVYPEQIALHAGLSSWYNSKNLNTTSIGIEFHCPGYADHDDWYQFKPFTEQQLEVGFSLVQHLQRSYSIKQSHIIGHSDIAPYRFDSLGGIRIGKTDPSPLFPWHEWAKKGVGRFPDILQHHGSSCSIEYLQSQLYDAGYTSCPQTGILDAKTHYVIQAFLYHYDPSPLPSYRSVEIIKRIPLVHNLLKDPCFQKVG